MSQILENIKNLRETTGAGFLDCKKALEENNNDLESSIDFLRKKGLAKANKKSSRETKEGAVGVFFNEKKFSIIQINTETDFSAKNEVFLSFMEKIGNFSLLVEEENMTLGLFNDLKFENMTISDHFKDIISKIGENIVLTKYLTKNYEKNKIASYIHNSYKKNIGKIAVVIDYKVHEPNEESKVLAKNLCMHIAASKPLAMNELLLDEQLVKKEREILLENIKSSGKPNNIIEKILEGKMKKFYSESTFLNQSYILDPDQTIKNVLENFSKNNKIEILNYYLFSLEI